MWKNHPIFKQYEAHETGLIRHVKNKEIRKMRECKDGYLRFNLVHDSNKITIKAHTFIADTFCDRGDGANTVHHIDGNKINNSAFNLKWVSNEENVSRAHKDGLHSKCHPVNVDGVLYYSKREAERKTGISRVSL